MNAKTLRRVLRPSAGLILAAVVAFVFAGRGSFGPFVQAQSNPIVAENALAGTLDNWDVSGAGDPSIQGFATDISVNKGDTVSFKVKTDTNNYVINIYRLGYYGGAGARKMTPTAIAGVPRVQPACIVDGATGLADCGNWAVSASWSTANAVSGIYLAKLTRIDNGGSSHIVFIVRDDTRPADVVVQTSDTTWQAYNQYGGGSLYCAGPYPNLPPYSCTGRATKVSYNRPMDTRQHDATSFLFNAEYPMVRFLEANGYNVKYISGVDTERRAADLVGALKPKAFLSVGHDEYWSAGQRKSVEDARNAGVNLAFFSGNEMYWKTRFESSIAGTPTPYRTLVGYKDTIGGVKLDPTAATTGTWRDMRFAPPVADGGRPENGLIGQIWTVNSGTSAITVPASMAKLRFWKNTRVANLTPTDAPATLGRETLGYEWDEDLDNGARPDGLIHLSATTVTGVEKILDYGETVGIGTATHNLTLYRHSSGALVFGAGTVQWSWGLDAAHDRGTSPVADQAIQQATVNLLADMGAQPGFLQVGADPLKPLIAAAKSTDAFAPSSVVTSPAAGGSVGSGDRLTITGTATESGGGIVAGVEVSVDGGASWHAAQGTTAWTYDWTPGAVGGATIRTRATDDSGNRENAGAGFSVSIVAGSCPCPTIFSASALPAIADVFDETPVELGLKFKSDVNGFVKGVRFYKSISNSGTHVGNLWTIGGTLLASATFTAETPSGWQEMLFNGPIPVTANTTYVVSYHTNVGHYSASGGYFTSQGADRSPLHAPASGTVGGNGVYVYGTTAFPKQTFNATNYFVDVVFDSTADTVAPLISDIRATPVDSAVALVTWTTDEGSTSRVDVSLSSSFPALGTVSVTDGAFVTAHSLRVTGLTPSTAYYFRVRSTDRSGNEASKPSLTPAPPPAPGGPAPPLPQGFTMPNPTLHDTMWADFAAGSLAGTYAAETFDGELTLAPAKGTEFPGTTIPAGWAAQIYSTGGFAKVANGKLTVDGARVAACVVDAAGVCQENVYHAPGTSLEFVATFTGDAYQHSGFGKTLASYEPIALFSTTWTDINGAEHSGSSLGVRTYNGTDAAETRTNLGPGFLGQPHRFRIDWQADRILYFVDGAPVATHSVAIPGQMRPVAASDFNVMSGDIVVDWIRTTPYALSGTFLSRVFDGSATGVDWNNISWTADIPTGTTLALRVRSGNTPTPDTTWSAFAPVAPGPIVVRSRYIQYGVAMATSDKTITPALSDIRISGVALAPAPPPPSDQTITFGPLAPKRIGDLPFQVTALSSSGLPVTFAIASGPATMPVGSDIVTITGVGVVTVRASAAGGSIGGATYRPAPDVDQSFTVAPLQTSSSVAVASNNTPSLSGVEITLTATVSPTGATGAVTFMDGTAALACVAGSSLTAPIATCKTSALAIGTHAITAGFEGNASLFASTSPAFSQVITPSAKLQIKYNVFALQDGTTKPKVAVVPAPNAVVKVFSTATSCAGNIVAALSPKKWGAIFDGADGPGGVDGCAPVSYGSYQAMGTTDANGLVTIIVPQLSMSPGTHYLVIGRATTFDYVKTATSPDPLYSMYPLLAVPAGTTRKITLALVATFNGKIVPGKSIEEYGSYLAIIQPEYMDWTDSVELYPFVLVAEGDWGIETSVTPPDGFVADQPVLATEVVDAVTALQFKLTDIGSDWTETGITHVITHKGETRIRTSAVPMFNRQPNAAAGDNAGKTDTQTATGEVKRPLLPSRLIAKLVGLLY